MFIILFTKSEQYSRILFDTKRKIEVDLFIVRRLKMYSKSTHKTVKAVYAAPERVFCVPKDWNLDDVEVLFDDFYYKGVKQDVPSVLQESEMKIAYDVTEDMDDDLIAWFDCEDDEDADE